MNSPQWHDRHEDRGHRSRSHGLRARGPTQPSTPIRHPNNAEGGDRANDNALTLKRG